MAVFVKISVSRKQLTTLGIVHLCVVFVVFGIIQRSMQQTEIFSDEHEWHPRLGDGFGSRPNVTQSARRFPATWTVQHQSASRASVTLFTTFEHTHHREAGLCWNTLVNWAALKPLVLPVLFVNPANGRSKMWAQAALSFGWEVRNVTKTVKGLPVLKSMLVDIVEHYDTPFCGYAKSNVLFDGSLITDMQLHLRYLKAYEASGGLMLIGRGTELSVDGPRRFDPADLGALSELGRRNGTLADSYLEDYLITTRHAFPWTHTPELVVGASGYGNWLVVKAQLCNITVIDASYTLTALHQAAKTDGYWRVQDPLRCVNRRFVKLAKFDCSKGVAECAPYASHRDKSGNVKLYRRPYRPYHCLIDYSEPCMEDLDQYDVRGMGVLF